MCGIEFDLVLVIGSKLNCFLCGGSKLIACGPKSTCVRCGNRLIWPLCGCSKLTCIFDAGRKSLGFGVSIEVDLVMCVWSKLACFPSGRSILHKRERGASNPSQR